ncbi:general secretion pathway protein GspB [Photobacterium carnosum]|uniref:general secretion pathway protein GspB n=1 Tax=Photobacterium carnosum TaxID=2023717 RepID=UPI00128B9607|nr:general secretion pathway protein GspB [Photobacterium carnosum]KAE8176468.1 hypothetical protein CIT27_12805 [Photobacterium carnosum]MCD9499710.1 hypothetical protein [Photobacterium carnosum]MCD9515209.1 hypothetical protein [Photobacterium carnosum]MCD9537961.1 hypothetical protein [Photobacterium carnosum]MCD9553271.1 hypothetical protein [Photobacterium carnosum]
MSQLLTALKQSDENNVTQLSRGNTNGETMKIVHPMRTVKAQQSRIKWVMPIIIALLPAASIVAYKVYQQHSVITTAALNHQPELKAVALAVSTHSVSQPPNKQALHLTQATADTDVIFMAYPDLVTEPLPISDSLYSASPAYSLNDDSESQYADLGPTYDDVAVQSPVKHVTKAAAISYDPYKLDSLDLSDLSPDIAAKLKSAIVATDGEQYQDSEVDRSNADRNAIKPHSTVTKTPKSNVIPIGLLPNTVQRLLPKMNFNQHIYSSTPTKRWVKVNGHERHQGDIIAPGVKLVKIESRDVILTFDGYEISMPALSEW